MRRTILCLALLSVVALSQDVLAARRLNQWTAINIGLGALKAKYPDQYRDLILKYRPFVAKYEGGIWQVGGKSPMPGILGGGAPVIEIRDRDSKVLKLYFQR